MSVIVSKSADVLIKAPVKEFTGNGQQWLCFHMFADAVEGDQKDQPQLMGLEEDHSQAMIRTGNERLCGACFLHPADSKLASSPSGEFPGKKPILNHKVNLK